MGPEFFQTGMGRVFFESTMPRIADALARIADALNKGQPPVAVAQHVEVNRQRSGVASPSRKLEPTVVAKVKAILRGPHDDASAMLEQIAAIVEGQ